MDPTSSTGPQRCAALYALPDLLKLGSFSKSHLYNLMQRGCFPKPVVRVGPRFTRWSASSVHEWFADPQGWMARNSNNGGGAA